MATADVSTLAPRKARARSEHRVLRSLPYLAPAVLLYGIFLIYPMLDSVRLSFFSWSGYAADPQEFVGLKNYRYLLTQDTVFWTALKNSMIWVVLSIAIPMVLSLLMALALNQRIWGRHVFRSIFYIPSVFASITVAAIWRWIYNPTLGVINQVLDAIGLGSFTHEWLGTPRRRCTQSSSPRSGKAWDSTSSSSSPACRQYLLSWWTRPRWTGLGAGRSSAT